MCTPYMEAVTAARFTFEYRYPNIVNQDQEQTVSINKTRIMAENFLFQTRANLVSTLILFLGQFKQSFYGVFPIFHPEYQKC